MSVLYKKELYYDPTKPDAPKRYHPRLVTLGQSVKIETLSWKIKERSSLSNGEILSVLKNFVEVMRECLFDGQSVNIAGFGIFSLSCTSEGATIAKDCNVSKIKQVHIKFRPASSIRIDHTSTRAGESIEFLDLQSYIDSLKLAASPTGGENDGEDDGGGGPILNPEG